MEIKQIHQYEMFHLIGQGIGSTIYKAWDSEKKCQVAVKLLNPVSYIQRDFDKIKLYENVIHPNLCRIHTVEHYQDSILIVSDYIEGKPLSEMLVKSEFPKGRFLYLFKKIAEALIVLYKNNLIHGNLKPSNIILSDTFEPILTDPGLSPFKNFQKTPEFVVPYEAYHYIAPEQILNREPTNKSDFFALGVIAYRILTNRLPFTGNNEEETTQAILTQAPDYALIQPEQIRGIYSLFLGKMLAKDPTDRFATGGELLATINEVALFDQNIEDYSPFKPAPSSPRKYLSLSVLALLFIILWLVLTLSSRH